MSKHFHFFKSQPCPTDLTWEEQSPSSYLLNKKVLSELQQSIEQIKKEQHKEVKEESGEEE